MALVRQINDVVSETLSQNQENNRALASICKLMETNTLGAACNVGPAMTAPSMITVLLAVFGITLLIQIRGGGYNLRVRIVGFQSDWDDGIVVVRQDLGDVMPALISFERWSEGDLLMTLVSIFSLDGVLMGTRPMIGS